MYYLYFKIKQLKVIFIFPIEHCAQNGNEFGQMDEKKKKNHSNQSSTWPPPPPPPSFCTNLCH